ncbi:hypothetical protein DEFDS_P202 (plasmid) [Deferribacter desulfuricans SSM1]|uniref:Transglycosylase SLT domain-containing protein n=1 Tax=Deferribacter desulfuricans (strain DSM 14783 / JCM 11476 / NBRC 101012 / SSM1) TaxID=639282 RepID=D3PF30_DEFDS|nr:hypothetical protein [Deferribacter desulfuricans]BAI81822.1 hypothetical protein DEFDS_P202 [Deferribacter desulfuricans SSM1]
MELKKFLDTTKISFISIMLLFPSVSNTHAFTSKKSIDKLKHHKSSENKIEIKEKYNKELYMTLLRKYNKFDNLNYLIYKAISEKFHENYDHTFINKVASILTSISFHESNLNENLININRIKLRKTSNKNFVSYLKGLKIGIEHGQTYISKFLIKYSVHFNNGKVLHKRIVLDFTSTHSKKQSLKKIDSLIHYFSKISSGTKIFVKTNYPIAFNFDNKQYAKSFLSKLIKFTKNIDIGMFQINYLYNKRYLNKYHYTVYDLLYKQKAFDVAFDIFHKHLEATDYNIKKAVGYYHHRNHKINSKYVKRVLAIKDLYNYIKTTVLAYKKIDRTHQNTALINNNEISLL